MEGGLTPGEHVPMTGVKDGHGKRGRALRFRIVLIRGRRKERPTQRPRCELSVHLSIYVELTAAVKPTPELPLPVV